MIEVFDTPVPQPKERRVTLHADRIYRDVESITYKTAETVIDDTTVADRISADSEDTLDGAILSRFLNSRIGQLRKRLAFCLKEEEIVEIDNNDDIEGSFVFDLVLDDKFNDGDLRPAVGFMHDYVVKGILVDWYKHTGSQQAAVLAPEADALEEKVVEIFRGNNFQRHHSLPYIPSYRTR